MYIKNGGGGTRIYRQTVRRAWLNRLSSSYWSFMHIYLYFIGSSKFPFGCYELRGKFSKPCSGYNIMVGIISSLLELCWNLVRPMVNFHYLLNIYDDQSVLQKIMRLIICFTVKLTYIYRSYYNIYLLNRKTKRILYIYIQIRAYKKVSIYNTSELFAKFNYTGVLIFKYLQNMSKMKRFFGRNWV